MFLAWGFRACAGKKASLNPREPRLRQRAKHRERVEKRVKLGSDTAGLEMSNLHPTRPFCDKRAHPNSQDPIADCLVRTITSSLAVPLLLVPQVGKQVAAHAGLTPILNLPPPSLCRSWWSLQRHKMFSHDKKV